MQAILALNANQQLTNGMLLILIALENVKIIQNIITLQALPVFNVIFQIA